LGSASEDALKKALERRQAEQEETRANGYRESLMRLRKKLDTDVEAGKIGEEMAKKLYERAERAIDQNKKAMAHLMKVKEELGALFEAGKISREEYIGRYEGALKAVRERMDAERKETLANEARE